MKRLDGGQKSMGSKKNGREKTEATGKKRTGGMPRRRFCYAAAFLLLLCVEVLIALYVHDSFVRPYLGDVLAVIAVYCFVRIFLPERVRFLPFSVFLFAAGVEALQYFRLADRLGLAKGSFVGILLGSVFDWKDIACYAAGCALLAGWERWLCGRKKD